MSGGRPNVNPARTSATTVTLSSPTLVDSPNAW